MGLIFPASPSFILSTWLVRRDGPTDGDAADNHASQPVVYGVRHPRIRRTEELGVG